MIASNDCVTHAFNAYLRRASEDTNPVIVQLLLPDRKGDAHWYYKSDQIVSTSAFDWPEYFKEYEGPVDELPDIVREYFLPNRFTINRFLTNLAKKSSEAGCKSYEEASETGFNLRKSD